MTPNAILLAFAVLAASMLLEPPPLRAQSATHSATLPIDGASRVEIEGKAGYLKVTGQSGATSVTVRGTARASSDDLLSQVRLIAERRGNVIHIEAVTPFSGRSGGGFLGLGNSWAALDLDITVPAGAAVSANDGSGDAEFRGTGALRVHDGSGNLSISDVMGEVDVEDGSGDVTIINVTGPVRIKDASGGIRMEGVGHDITIRDGSGEITLRRVGNVVVESDGSGGINVSQASGSVRIVSPGSGGIAVSDIAGDFTVESGRRSRIRHNNVRGTVRIPSR